LLNAGHLCYKEVNNMYELNSITELSNPCVFTAQALYSSRALDDHSWDYYA